MKANFVQNEVSRNVGLPSEVAVNVIVPNPISDWKDINATGLGETEAQFQATGLNSHTDGIIEIVGEYLIEASGNIKYDVGNGPSNNGTAVLSALTSANYIARTQDHRYLLSKYNLFPDAGAINKSISEVTFGVGSQTFKDDQRNARLFDIYMSQWSPEKLKKYGIMPFRDTKGTLDTLVGSGADELDVTLANVTLNSNAAGAQSQASTDCTSLSLQGFDLSQSCNVNHLFGHQRWERGYIEVIENKFYSSTAPDIALNTLFDYNGVEYINGTQASDTVITTQKMKVRVREYLIAPDLSNPYLDNVNYKPYYISGNSNFNINLKFDTNYAKEQMFKWTYKTAVTKQARLPPPSAGLTNAGGGLSLTHTVKATKMTMRLKTFSSNKIDTPLSQTTKTLYYKPTINTSTESVSVNASGDTITANLTYNTPLLNSVSPYYIVYADCPVTQQVNDISYNTPCNTASSLFAPIRKLSVKFAGKGIDVLYNRPIEKIYEETSEFTADKEFFLPLLTGRQYCQSTRDLYTTERDVPSVGSTNGVILQDDINTGSALLVMKNYNFKLGSNSAILGRNTGQLKNGLPFLILDMSKAYLGNTKDGTPIVPQVIYGALTPLSFQFSAEIGCPPNAQIGVTNVQLHVVAMDKYLRTIAPNNAPISDRKCEWFLQDVMNGIVSVAASESSQYEVNSQVIYVGGGFLDNIMMTIQKYGDPLMKGLRKLTDFGIKNLAEGSTGHTASMISDQALKLVGYGENAHMISGMCDPHQISGRSGRVGRPMKR